MREREHLAVYERIGWKLARKSSLSNKCAVSEWADDCAMISLENLDLLGGKVDG